MNKIVLNFVFFTCALALYNQPLLAADNQDQNPPHNLKRKPDTDLPEERTLQKQRTDSCLDISMLESAQDVSMPESEQDMEVEDANVDWQQKFYLIQQQHHVYEQKIAEQNNKIEKYKERYFSFYETLANENQPSFLNVARTYKHTFPKLIFTLNSLTNLDISHNPIKSLDESFTQLNNLESLTIGNAEFASFPEEICMLPCLKELILSNDDSVQSMLCYWEPNKFTSIPESFGSLITLTSLDLACNYLTSLPKSFSQLENLTFLSLEANDLKSVPDSLIKLINLRDLNLTNNPDINAYYNIEEDDDVMHFNSSDDIRKFLRIDNNSKLYKRGILLRNYHQENSIPTDPLSIIFNLMYTLHAND